MSAAATGQSDERLVVLISPTVEREFVRLDVYPQLRLQHAARIQNGATGMHRIGIDLAKQLLACAEAERGRPGLPRGLAAAWTALAKRLRRAAAEHQRRGLLDDPGFEEASQQARRTPATLEPGERVLYFSHPDGDPEWVRIEKPFGLCYVKSPQGPYVNSDGVPVAYRPGYLVKAIDEDGQPTFTVPAHMLTRAGCQPAHLCLAAVNGNVAEEARS